MQFQEFKKAVQDQVESMLQNESVLFVTNTDKDELWRVYLESFPSGTNTIFRERREFDCSACRQFIRSFGNVVAIIDNCVVSIWDIETQDATYQPVVEALAKYVTSKQICDVFVTKESKHGIDKNHEQCADGFVQTWQHLFVELPQRYVLRSSKSEASVMAEYRDAMYVFRRSLEEISQEAVDVVLELIAQNSLYKGEEWQHLLQQFLVLHKAYHELPDAEKFAYCWKASVKAGAVIGKIKNHSIGVLLTDLSQGMDVNDALRKYEAIVAPSNYKRPKAIFTQKMIEQAQRTIEELGLLDSLGGRFATIEDITVNNILFANRDSLKCMTNVFDGLQAVTKTPRTYDHVEEIPIDRFVESVLPTVRGMEVLFENQHVPNLVSLIAPIVRDSKTILKWDNNFRWAYNGNITDSMKERVKQFGGNVTGDLRCSLQWDNNNDLDLHCVEQGGNEIWFRNKGHRHPSTGMLDVDIMQPSTDPRVIDGLAVENITYADRRRMKEGVYTFFVECFSNRQGRTGFEAEIEFDGIVHTFHYAPSLRQNERIDIAKVRYSQKNGFSIVSSLPTSVSTREVWGLKTNQFYQVSVMMQSPNFWDGQCGIGHRHYFFMLNGCVNDTRPNGFFNEFLREDLLQHKRVFEALGSKLCVDPSDNQLSGVGFSATKRNALVVKLDGHVHRTVKITF